ncbi:MAG: alkaline phosphatase [Gammaproteobacteria bacterium]|nr:alkaline phosphatase [Gammaproteobacteria bacterium]
MKKYSILLTALLAGCATSMPSPTVTPPQDTAPSDYTGTTGSWLADGEAAVRARASQRLNTRRAKNVILFVGDGMSVSTLTAGRILEGQLAGRPGEENLLSFEQFPNTALVKTYNVNAQVADSAGTASALNTGTKTEMGVINTAPTHKRGVCKDYMADAPKPLAFYAEQIGMSTGVVSTARLTHATPAAVYAHSPDRGWEGDSELPEEAKENGCPDIASQILGAMDGDGLEVALGGGARFMLPTGVGDGMRLDGRNIPEEWVASTANAKYVSNKTELEAVDTASTDRLLGLFTASHMEFSAQRTENQPELADLTETAIEMLSKNKKGYYLMVEAGRIDHAHHGSAANLALNDTVALSKAVKRALELIDLKDTLIIVTADHSHTFTMAGYPKRGNPILGLVSGPGMAEGEYIMALDGKPYTTLGYQNGPNAAGALVTPDPSGDREIAPTVEPKERDTLTDEIVSALTYRQQSAYPLWSETHGGEDVAAHAAGPWSHLVRGTIEQNEIFHIIDHALKLRKRAEKKR